MASKKPQTKWWYILVMTNEGPKFVTDIGSDRTAKWEKDKPPYEMSEKWAMDVAAGLTWNGATAFAVCSKFAITHQPYLYKMGHFEWVREDKDGNDEDKGE